MTAVQDFITALTSSWGTSSLLLRLTGLCLAWYIVFLLFAAVRNVYFHPLSHVPGPKLWIAFPFIKFAVSITGTLDEKVRHYHELWGPTIRITPIELSFTQPSAWNDIHGAKNQPELPRHMSQFEAPANDIIRADTHHHARFRKALGYGFSDRALREQEPLLQSYITLLLSHFHDAAEVQRPVNVTQWFNFFTFDLIGDLAYGQSFDSLKSGTMHPYIASLIRAFPARPIITGALDYPVLAFLFKHVIMRTSAKRKRQEMLAFASDTVLRRLADGSKKGRVDFVDAMERNKGTDVEITEGEMISNATIILAAGSETTATLLTGFVYFLCRDPEALHRVTNEVRGAFKTEEEITIASTAETGRVPYLMACMEETFRMYPPVPASNPRRTVLPVTLVAGMEVPKGTAVGVHHSAAYWSKRNFVRPREYRPERWLKREYWRHDHEGDEFLDDKREVLQPFTVGPRNCIGKNLALAEIRMVMARMLWNFDLAFEDEEKAKDWEKQKAFTVWQKGPLEVRITERSDRITCNKTQA